MTSKSTDTPHRIGNPVQTGRFQKRPFKRGGPCGPTGHIIINGAAAKKAVESRLRVSRVNKYLVFIFFVRNFAH